MNRTLLQNLPKVIQQLIHAHDTNTLKHSIQKGAFHRIAQKECLTCTEQHALPIIRKIYR
jgi:hypothetical protein